MRIGTRLGVGTLLRRAILSAGIAAVCAALFVVALRGEDRLGYGLSTELVTSVVPVVIFA